MGKFALLIGVSEYAEGLSALPAAAKDIVAVQRVLEDPSLGAFDQVQALLNPSRDEMASTIELWTKARATDDLALLYFSGHGVLDDRRELYFASSTTRKVQADLLTATAVSARAIHDFCRYSSPSQQILILDCCFSGAFGRLQPRDDGSVDLAERLRAEGRVVLTSTGSTGYAFEEKEKPDALSVYTRHLVEGIEKGTADPEGTGFITVGELHRFAKRKVAKSTPAMQPEIITLEGEGYDIRLARVPQDKPELQYRREVEKRARAKGKITTIGRRILNRLRQDLGLSNEAAAAIEAEVLQPFVEYRRKLTDYEEILAEALEEMPELDQDHLNDLSDYQSYLGLKDRDVQEVQTRLAGRVLWLEPQIVKQYESESVLVTGSTNQYPTFTFASVRVDEQGQEIEKIPGKADCFVEDIGNGITLDMVRIPLGKFLMGASEGEEGASKDEYPQHSVTVAEFWIGKYVVTQAQWRAVTALEKVDRDLNEAPSHFKGDNRPVERISWEDAMEFCQRLSRHSQKEYTLPSEAQWEYACRAGTTTPFHCGPTITTDWANYDGHGWTNEGTTYPGSYGSGPKGDYRQETTPVEKFLPNSFGLYDMHGNVWEWCLDGWHEDYQGAPNDGSVWESSDKRKILRGGSWSLNPADCRAAYRYRIGSDNRSNIIGFRVCSYLPRT